MGGAGGGADYVSRSTGEGGADGGSGNGEGHGGAGCGSWDDSGGWGGGDGDDGPGGSLGSEADFANDMSWLGDDRDLLLMPLDQKLVSCIDID